MSTSKGSVDLATAGGVATLTIANEARRNAMSLAMWQQLAAHLETIEADGALRAVLLRGVGDQAFVSGADISEFETLRSSPDTVAQYNAAVDRAQGGLQRLRCPVIAAISGVCYGGGVGLALACDLRYAAEGARFRMPAARLGLGYALEGLRRMSAVMGVSAASELFYTARVYDAQGAAKLGLVNAVAGDVFAHAEAVAQDIAANAPLTVGAAKLAFRCLQNQPLAGTEAVQAAVERCFASEDYAEGSDAFKEKRTPQFKGR
jgi:enoyl-CoA hydratase